MCGDGTGHLKRHAAKHEEAMACSEKGNTQTQLNLSSNIHHYNPELDKECLAKIIIKSECTILFAQNLAFKWYCKTVHNSQSKGFSRNTIRNEAMKLFLIYKDKLKNVFN